MRAKATGSPDGPGYERMLRDLPPLPSARWRRAVYRATGRRVHLG
ncbi:hypothetical protein ABH917_003771 [Thermobifida halotolerans]|nr:hypothetical protein [Thermobifida halotolerans]